MGKTPMNFPFDVVPNAFNKEEAPTITAIPKILFQSKSEILAKLDRYIKTAEIIEDKTALPTSFQFNNKKSDIIYLILPVSTDQLHHQGLADDFFDNFSLLVMLISQNILSEKLKAYLIFFEVLLRHYLAFQILKFL